MTYEAYVVSGTSTRPQVDSAFRKQVTRHWLKTLRRRSQRTTITWARMNRLEIRWLPKGHRQVIWECLWRSRCEWTGWQKMVAEFVFQAAAAVMIWFQTAKRLVISVRHPGALIR